MKSAWPTHFKRRSRMNKSKAIELARKTPKALKEAAEDEILCAIARQIMYIRQDGDEQLAQAVKKIGEDTAKKWGFVHSDKYFSNADVA